ncbi:MAG: alpha-mannosidase [Clostridiales bacterium]|nr:alpha-mannosidase [Clostridiales bacterium]
MNVEQKDLLALVLNALKRDFYHPMGEIALSGFVAQESMLLPQAQLEPRHPIPEGTVWGKAWQYAWMFGEIIVPDEAKGRRIVMSLNPGGESTLFVNGMPFGTRRAEWVTHPHHYIVDQMLTNDARGGETFSLALEVYGGTPLPVDETGRRSAGPIFPEEGVRMPPEPAPTMGRNTFGWWNEDAYQLWLDLAMLLDIYETQPEDSYLREKIGHELGRLLDTLDMEQTVDKRIEAYRQARGQIAPLMQAKNGTFAPSMSVIGNSHLDVAWEWPLAETRRKTIRTFAQQLRLLEEYPEALYLQSQCVLYDMVEKQYPELYEKIKEAIARGQWIAEGAMWVEPDANLAGGEALIRQFLYGKRYFREKLNTDSRIAWLPDSFGYSAAIPQIIKGCGITGLTTQKIFWSYNDSEPFPYNAFSWKGIDGTQVPCYLHMWYESPVDANTLHKLWNLRLHKDGSGEFFVPFGYGDGGGGPTRDDLEQIRRQQDLQGSPKLHYINPAHLFDGRDEKSMPVYRGELYFPCHRGTYTIQAAVKKGNRQSENAMRTYELWSAAAAWENGAAYPYENIESRWKDTLLNQFHDILPGSAIHRVNAEAEALYGEILADAKAGTDAAIASMTRGGEGVTLYHAQSAARTQVVRLDGRFARGARTADGKIVPCLPFGDGALACVALPPMGTVTLYPAEAESSAPVTAQETAQGYVLSSDVLEAIIDHEGHVLSVKDLETGRERVGGPSNRLQVFRNVPRAFDAWDIDSQTLNREVELNARCESEIVLESGMRAAVRVVTHFLSSQITQIISLDAGAKRLDFDTHIEWNEHHRLLKATFDTGIDAPEAANQVQFGYIMRPAHRSRKYDQDRFEVCSHSYTAMFDAAHGAAVLNDCKYGVSTLEGKISLSLICAGTNPDPDADIRSHDFRYAYTFWDGSFEQSGVVAEAGALNTSVLIADGARTDGPLFTVDDPSVVIETVKLAEDRSGDLIVRLYESMNGLRRTTFRTAFAAAQILRCNMLEEIQEELEVTDGAAVLNLHPFEIVTLRLKKA